MRCRGVTALVVVLVLLGACDPFARSGIPRSEWSTLEQERVVAFIEGRTAHLERQGLVTSEDIVERFGEPPYVDDTRSPHEGAEVLEWRYPDAHEGEVWMFFFHLDVPGCTDAVTRGCSPDGAFSGWFLGDVFNPASMGPAGS